MDCLDPHNSVYCYPQYTYPQHGPLYVAGFLILVGVIIIAVGAILYLASVGASILFEQYVDRIIDERLRSALINEYRNTAPYYGGDHAASNVSTFDQKVSKNTGDGDTVDPTNTDTYGNYNEPNL